MHQDIHLVPPPDLTPLFDKSPKAALEAVFYWRKKFVAHIINEMDFIMNTEKYYKLPAGQISADWDYHEMFSATANALFISRSKLFSIYSESFSEYIKEHPESAIDRLVGRNLMPKMIDAINKEHESDDEDLENKNQKEINSKYIVEMDAEIIKSLIFDILDDEYKKYDPHGNLFSFSRTVSPLIDIDFVKKIFKSEIHAQSTSTSIDFILKLDEKMGDKLKSYKNCELISVYGDLIVLAQDFCSISGKPFLTNSKVPAKCFSTGVTDLFEYSTKTQDQQLKITSLINSINIEAFSLLEKSNAGYTVISKISESTNFTDNLHKWYGDMISALQYSSDICADSQVKIKQLSIASQYPGQHGQDKSGLISECINLAISNKLSIELISNLSKLKGKSLEVELLNKTNDILSSMLDYECPMQINDNANSDIVYEWAKAYNYRIGELAFDQNIIVGDIIFPNLTVDLEKIKKINNEFVEIFNKLNMPLIDVIINSYKKISGNNSYKPLQNYISELSVLLDKDENQRLMDHIRLNPKFSPIDHKATLAVLTSCIAKDAAKEAITDNRKLMLP